MSAKSGSRGVTSGFEVRVERALESCPGGCVEGSVAYLRCAVRATTVFRVHRDEVRKTDVLDGTHFQLLGILAMLESDRYSRQSGDGLRSVNDSIAHVLVFVLVSSC